MDNPEKELPQGAFVRVQEGDHPLPIATEVAVYVQDYYASGTRSGYFGKVIGYDPERSEYLLMLSTQHHSLTVHVRRVEWQKTTSGPVPPARSDDGE